MNLGNSSSALSSVRAPDLRVCDECPTQVKLSAADRLLPGKSAWYIARAHQAATAEAVVL